MLTMMLVTGQPSICTGGNKLDHFPKAFTSIMYDSQRDLIVEGKEIAFSWKKFSLCTTLWEGGKEAELRGLRFTRGFGAMYHLQCTCEGMVYFFPFYGQGRFY